MENVADSADAMCVNILNCCKFSGWTYAIFVAKRGHPAYGYPYLDWDTQGKVIQGLIT